MSSIFTTALVYRFRAGSQGLQLASDRKPKLRIKNNFHS